MTFALSSSQKAALVDLRRGRPDVRVVLIGATAVSHYVTLDRFTADVDLVLVAELSNLAAVLEPLGWRRDARQMQRWVGPNGIFADVLPAAPALVAKGEVAFAPDCVMSLVGFDLLLATAETIAIETGIDFEIASLPALTVLKMVAWLDRPDRIKDLGDLARIMASGLGSDDDRRFDPSSVIFDVEYYSQSAFFVGSEIRRVAKSTHLDVARRFLAQVRRPDAAGFLQMLRESDLRGDDAEERLASLLNSFERGLNHER